jgi:hypothetical protein
MTCVYVCVCVGVRVCGGVGVGYLSIYLSIYLIIRSVRDTPTRLLFGFYLRISKTFITRHALKAHSLQL